MAALTFNLYKPRPPPHSPRTTSRPKFLTATFPWLPLLHKNPIFAARPTHVIKSISASESSVTTAAELSLVEEGQVGVVSASEGSATPAAELSLVEEGQVGVVSASESIVTPAAELSLVEEGQVGVISASESSVTPAAELSLVEEGQVVVISASESSVTPAAELSLDGEGQVGVVSASQSIVTPAAELSLVEEGQVGVISASESSVTPAAEMSLLEEGQVGVISASESSVTPAAELSLVEEGQVGVVPASESSVSPAAELSLVEEEQAGVISASESPVSPAAEMSLVEEGQVGVISASESSATPAAELSLVEEGQAGIVSASQSIATPAAELSLVEEGQVGVVPASESSVSPAAELSLVEEGQVAVVSASESSVTPAVELSLVEELQVGVVSASESSVTTAAELSNMVEEGQVGVGEDDELGDPMAELSYLDPETDPESISEWEMDFCSRPILDIRGKKMWELVVCDSTLSLQYTKYFPNNAINSVTLKDAIENICDELDIPLPQKIRFFRSQMRTIITKACNELAIKPVPSKRCISLLLWLEERYETVYTRHPGFQKGSKPLLALDKPFPMQLPENLFGDKWAFVQLPFSSVQEEVSSLETRYAFGASLDLDLLGLEIDSNTLIPGLAVASSRAKALAAWMNGLEICSLEADTSRACLILSVGVSTRYIYATYQKNAASTQEAEAWEAAKKACGGLHFIAIQENLDSDQCNGIWLLLDLPPPPV